MLDASALSFAYENGTPILDDVNVTINKSEIVALLGASGCGKSTLLRVLSGLEDGQGGTIRWHQDKNFSFVFQEPSLMPWATVAENVMLPLKISGAAPESILSPLLAEVGLEGLEGRYPSSLSGGQKMRVSLARALVAEPSLMFLDEPFAALDEILRFQMNELLLKLRREHQLACVFVTHSLYEAAYLADRVLIIGEGKILGSCSPKIDRSLEASAQRSSKKFFLAVDQISTLLAGAGS